MSDNKTPWGRVDADTTVYVRDGDSERAVGSYPDGSAEEALAYFERKYNDLAGQLSLLEARIARGSADAAVIGAVTKLQEALVAPAAVGDLANLRERAAALLTRAQDFVDKQQQERAQLRQEAVAKREEIISAAEQLVQKLDNNVRWKTANDAFEQLFNSWQELQKQGPHLPKQQADALWRRFRAIRHEFESARRTYFAQLDANNKEVRARKERIIAAAEALASRGVDGIPSYRKLLEDWKAAGRSNRKIDDQLWNRFKTAGDVLYAAKAVEVAQTNEEYQQNLQAKTELLSNAQPILELQDHVKARKELTAVQLQWDEIGRVPREAMQDIDDKLRRLETHVKQLEDQHWSKNNPETKARSAGLRGQLAASIAELEAEIAATSDPAKQAAAKEKLAAQQSWLQAIGD